jgi:hypothetical protein
MFFMTAPLTLFLNELPYPDSPVRLAPARSAGKDDCGARKRRVEWGQ